MELLVQLVILATALVGLYKAVTLGPEPSKGRGTSRIQSDHPFKMLLEMAGMWGTILLVPAFMLGLMWIMKTTQSLATGNESRSSIRVVETQASDLGYLLAAAGALRDREERETRIRDALAVALSKKDYRVALSAAGELHDREEGQEAVRKIIQYIKTNALSVPTK